MRQNILRDCRKDENQLSRPLERRFVLDKNVLIFFTFFGGEF